MSAEALPTGWAWLDGDPPPVAGFEVEDAFAACFASPAGRVVAQHLRRIFLDRRVPPSASDAELRHVEGQRAAIAWLLAMASPERHAR
jgi:hypothetical protein